MESKHTTNFFVTCLVTVMLLSGYYLMLPVFPLYMHSLAWTSAASGVIIGLFSISSLVIRPFSGVWTDRIGANRVILAGAACYLVAALLYLFSPSYLSFGASQLLFGAAIGGFTVALSTYVVVFIPKDRMALMFGWYSIAITLAKGMAPAIGLWVYEWSDFSPVLLLAVVSVAAGLLTCLYLPGFLPRREPDSPAGGVVVTPAAGRKSGGGEPLRSGVSEGGWLLYALGPSFSLLGIAFVFGAFNVLIPLYFRELSLAHASLFFVVETGTIVFFRIFMGSWLNWLSRAQWMFVAFASVLAALFILVWTSSFAGLLAVAVVFGLGYSIGFPMLNEMVVQRVPQSVRGAAIGLFTAAFDLGLMLGSLSLVLLEWWEYRQVFLLMAVVVLFSLISFSLYLRLVAGRRQTIRPA